MCIYICICICICIWWWVGTNQGSGVLAVESGDVVGRLFADVDLEVEEPAWEERDIARVQNVDVWSPYFNHFLYASHSIQTFNQYIYMIMI